jgi:hypothetical protein
MQELKKKKKKLLDFTGIIIFHLDRLPIDLENYEGIVLSDIIISEKLVSNYIDRYLIAHYLRNQINLLFEEYNPVLKEYQPIAESFYFSEYDLYIRTNAETICKVLYHFISNKFYNIDKNFHDLSYFLLRDNRLGTYGYLLKEKLRTEGSLIYKDMLE